MDADDRLNGEAVDLKPLVGLLHGLPSPLVERLTIDAIREHRNCWSGQKICSMNCRPTLKPVRSLLAIPILPILKQPSGCTRKCRC